MDPIRKHKDNTLAIASLVLLVFTSLQKGRREDCAHWQKSLLGHSDQAGVMRGWNESWLQTKTATKTGQLVIPPQTTGLTGTTV